MKRGALILFCAFLAAAPAPAEDQVVLPLQRLSLQNRDLIPDPGASTNAPGWKSSFTLGFSMTRGNSDTTLMATKLQTEKRADANEWLLGAGFAYGESEDVKIRETLNGFGQFNHFLTSRFYDFGRVDALHDAIKDIRYRVTASVGMGYYFMLETNRAYAVEAGPSLVSEGQGNEDQTYAAARIAHRFEYRFATEARIWHGAEFIPQVNDVENYVVNFEIGIETPIARNLALQVYLQDNYVSQPAPDYEHNDLRLISGLSYKF